MTAGAVGVALIGTAGHQLTPSEVEEAGGRVLVAEDTTGSDIAEVVRLAREAAEVPGVELVSVCLEPRGAQVEAALAALAAGRHVLIERPAAATLDDVERLAAAAERSAGRLWERATTGFDELYGRAARIVAAGILGDVVLVTTHRSYPWAQWRSADETVSGGLVLQSATYGLDVARLVVGRPLRSLRVTDTTRGEPRNSALRMAAVLTAEFDDGAVASIVADYLNPAGGVWGRDEVRVLGTGGRLSIDGAARELTWIDADGEHREIVQDAAPALAAAVIRAVRDSTDTDPTAASTLESTRWALRGLRDARRSFLDGQWPA